MSPSGGERKIATMLFADLVGSTELAAGRDPEEIRGRLEPFFEEARNALEQHGGTVEKYIGDAVMAVFGAPVAHGDDPDRAIAAGLEVARRVGELDGGLAVRIGIETGEILSVPEAGNLRVTGEAVNVAARLQQAAAPGEVLVGERTARACRRAQLEPNGAVEAKGIPGALGAYRAIAVEPETMQSGVPLLGRDDDLDMLRLIARRAARERLPQLVTVIGEAGIGKTRLGAELFRELRSDPDPWRTMVGRSPPYGEGIAFWALGEILRDAAGLSTDAPPDDVEAALAGKLAGLGATDADQIATGLTVAIRGAPDCDAEEELGRAWRRFVALLANDRPLAIGVDDAHWADEGTLELLEDVAYGIHDAPVLVLCTSRPELAEHRPQFGRAARNNTQLELLPLDRDAATRLAEMLLPQDRRAEASRIADAAGGNPFFTEEVSRRIGEGGADGAAASLPDTVQAAIAARIDQLPPDEKRALQYAAVLGHTFSQGPLGDLLGADPTDWLWSLRRRALIQERPGSEAGHYVFRHQLIREVAYNSLPRRERAMLHERAVEALRARDEFAERPELIAYHLDHAHELDPSDERRRAARDALVTAADAAVRRGAAARGRQLYEDAARLADDGVERYEALVAAGEVALRGWRGDLGMRLFREAAQAAEAADDTDRAAAAYARSVEIGARMHGIAGDPPVTELSALLKRGHELASDDDLVTCARLRLDDAWLAWMSKDPEAMAKPAQEGLELARRADDRQLLQNALDAATASDWLQGRQLDAVEHTRERLQLLDAAPRSHALDVEISDALHMMVLCLIQVGEFEEALTYAKRGAEVDRARGVEMAEYQRELMPNFFLGNWDRAIELGEGARKAWEEAGRPPMGAFATPAACTGAAFGYRGDEAAADDWMAHAHNLSHKDPEQRCGVHMFGVDLEIHRGRFADAVSIGSDPVAGSQWTATYAASRAEAFVRAGRDDAGEAIAWAEPRIGQDRYAHGILLRARGLHYSDDSLIRQSLERFEQMGCPFQAARSGWLLGGEEREEAMQTFERLGATLPAE
ncbi:MAG TPA: AAA family ATPase [Solirubrobacterales bacterium]|nr:AAA family ATPase [Solirubrobacterales bacterium]